ncbi:hypothetical protein [Chitinophaga tropicalis]|uniref:Uncharacterized protein n=1 Tax=Chitinophaga tropicalis TaxID=2683588 RepID=A0A7K1UDZ2_9BACT|nr:hypothetical protein [Chitinophaga tropicalis]MVT12601.1 hypothetical protein [Chitinophaga tropicalis]
MIKKIEDIFDAVYDGSQSSLDATLVKMKEAGASQMQSTVVLIKKLKLSIAEADHLIINSKAWEENRDNVIRLRNEFGDFLDSSKSEI